MERTKVKKEEKLPDGVYWWRKTGGGSFNLKIAGKVRIIKPNDRFAARMEEIPEGFRDVIVPDNKVTKAALDSESGPVDVPNQKMEYHINHRGGGYYDVLDKNKKRQNEKALRRDDAMELLEKLTGK